MSAPAIAKQGSVRPSRSNRKYRSVGTSTRVILSENPDRRSPLYALSSQSTVTIDLYTGNAGRAEGRSIRCVTTAYDPSIDLLTLPVTEISEWSGDFDYEIDRGLVSLFFKRGSSKGLFKEGKYKGKTFEEDFVSSSTSPHLVGSYSKNHQSIVFSTPELFQKITLISGGVEQIANWNYSATAVLVDM